MEPNLNTLDLKEKYIEQIIKICEEVFSDVGNVEIIAFGSRVNGTAQRASDIDLAIRGDGLARIKIRQFREMLEESTIPYTADVLLLSEADDRLKEKIENEGIVLWKN